MFKKGDSCQVGNYRPISLTGCDYKILAYILTARLSTHLPDIIHLSQTAYMTSRFIGMNIRAVQDMIDHNFESNTNGVVLFLDFQKAFDSISHTFLFSFLRIMKIPDPFIKWVLLMYQDAFSCVKYNNWLTPLFPLKCGVRQGCPLSCHLFNLVGQVLVYSLHHAGFHAWWQYTSDPSSLYADDGTLFLENRQQLPAVIQHIQMVRKYTSLTLNLDKMIVFNYNQLVPVKIARVLVHNELVKYLGVYIGLGNLTRMNFEVALRKARNVIGKWGKCKLSLPARVMVSKIFVFSTFVHICNHAWITADQIKLIQNILNNFVWNGWTKIKQYSPILAGGINMINIKNVLHMLRAKWMMRLCQD